MFAKTCRLSVIGMVLLVASATGKGPKDSSKYTIGKGYSGKGTPSRSSSSKYASKASRFPTQTPTKKIYSKQSYTNSTTSKSKGTTPSSSVNRFPSSVSSKYSKQRPSPSSFRQPSSSRPSFSIGSKPVQFPQRPVYTTQSSGRSPQKGKPGPSITSSGSKPIYQRPPTVFYPKPSKKPTPPSSSASSTRPALPSNQRPFYPSLRPPANNRPGSGSTTIVNKPTTIVNRPTSIVNRPTTIVNQNTNVTNRVTNNVSNVNNWFNGNSWKNSVTVNSRNWNNRPWWYTPDYGDWHHGNWHGNYYFRGRDAWSHVQSDQLQWLNGLVAWGLGNFVYRTGYQVYSNPYYSEPVVVGSTIVNYSQPISVQRSQYETLSENDDQRAEQLRRLALAYFDKARQAFYDGDESRAYTYINRAIAILPDDTSLHEFRALVLFAESRYREAAEVMHAVLAVAPGWDWTTMSGLYGDHNTYSKQLRSLENHIRLNPRTADARFLLAYHYITMGYPSSAEDQLRAVLILNPDDRLSADLLALLQKENSADDQFAPLRSDASGTAPLDGRWRAKRPNGEIELDMEDGNFKWAYDLPDNHEQFAGKYQITRDMMLLATEQGSQMAGTIKVADNNHFNFRLLGSSENDPGVEFVRK